MNKPSPPRPQNGPDKSWEHYQLYKRIVDSLYALPDNFATSLFIEGIPATDLFTLNTALGAAIEQSVVDSLNNLRDFWDPDKRYADYYFVRQSQRFPDVILKTDNPAKESASILMGIELKGWFVLSKEGEPSFRYEINPDCCADADLLVVLPWLFDSVISGKPVLMTPILTEAKYAAQQRNYHWEWIRKKTRNQDQSLRGIIYAQHKEYYPPREAKTSDKAKTDRGNNFGRIARCGIFTQEVEDRLAEKALGIPVDAWRRFIQIFSDGVSAQNIEINLSNLEQAFELPDLTTTQKDLAVDLLSGLAELLRSPQV